MDNIELGGYYPVNKIAKSNVLFLASFHNNDAILSQFQALVVLCESFIDSLTILLPFYPMGTMERVLQEGQVATASTIARMLSSLPHVGRPIRVMVYDIHTLQNRFYFSGGAIASPQSAIPLLMKHISAADPDAPEGCDGTKLFDAIAFPDEGAGKRFGKMFTGFSLVVCGKQRIGEERIVTIHDGDAAGKRILIVDDMVRSGGTLVKCAECLMAKGALSCSAYVTHAAGSIEDIQRFLKGGDRAVFKNLIITNSVPTLTDLLPATGDNLIILDIMDQFLKDL
jgi:phosphoribosylpyrophosphate synthetase